MPPPAQALENGSRVIKTARLADEAPVEVDERVTAEHHRLGKPGDQRSRLQARLVQGFLRR